MLFPPPSSLQPLACHPLVLNLDVTNPDGVDKARHEKLEEDIRLAYVALTRARNRVYVWAATSKNITASDHALTRVLERCQPRLGANTHVHVQESRTDWGDVPEKYVSGAGTAGELQEPKKIEVDKSHGHASFSSLAPNELRPTVAAMARDVDAGGAGEGVSDPVAVTATVYEPIFAILGGAKTGDCLHEILENVDFGGTEEDVRVVVDAALDKYKICGRPTDPATVGRREAVHGMVKNVLNVPLDAGCGSVYLKDVGRSARRSEMAFHFSLRQQGDQSHIKELAGILGRSWQTPARDDTFIEALGRGETQVPLGFMTGFIDLVFERNGRFYIVDWKSNRRGGVATDFAPVGLKQEMTKHSYYLQYMIYTVALHGFLARALKDYDYEKHFGGVFYLFLRGVDGTSKQGVFWDRPSLELVSQMSQFFVDGNGGVQ